MLQRCPRCKEGLDESFYHPSNWGKKGTWCKPCRKSYDKERSKRLWKEKVESPDYVRGKDGPKVTPERAREIAEERAQAATRKAEREANRAKEEAIREKYGYTPRYRERINAKAREFGIDKEYLLGLYLNDPKCSICGEKQEDLPRMLCVDHCHESGKFRGLLCDNCNTAIGLMKDDVDSLKKAIEYLEG